MNIIPSVIVAIASIDTVPAGKHSQLCRLMKAVFSYRSHSLDPIPPRILSFNQHGGPGIQLPFINHSTVQEVHHTDIGVQPAWPKPFMS